MDKSKNLSSGLHCRVIWLVSLILVSVLSIDASSIKFVKGYNFPNTVIHKEIRFKSDGKDYTMYFTDIGETRKNVVMKIFVIPDDYKSLREVDPKSGRCGENYNNPPRFIKLIVHMDGNPDTAFGSVLVEEITCDINGNNRKKIQREIKLPDDVTNYLFDVWAGDTELVLIDGLKKSFKETTDMTIQGPVVIDSLYDLNLHEKAKELERFRN